MKLYNLNEKNFNHNGLCGELLNASKCVITKKLMGEYSLNIEYPLNDPKSIYFKHNYIVDVNTPMGSQLFRIKHISKELDKVCIYCIHIFFDLSDNMILDTNIINKTSYGALTQLLNNTVYQHQFKVIGSDFGKKDNLRIVRYAPTFAILGDADNTLINRFDCEIDVDNFNIKCAAKIGKESNFKIRYGENMTSLLYDEDLTEITTGIIPIGFDGIMLPEKIIYSNDVGAYHQPIIKEVKFNDIRIVTKDEINESNPIEVTYNDCCKLMREKSKELFATGIDKPKLTIDVGCAFIKDNEFENIDVGDYVECIHDKNNISIKTRVTQWIYDVITNDYINITLASKKIDMSNDLSCINNNIKVTNDLVAYNANKFKVEIANSTNTLKSSFEILDNQITSKVEDFKNKTNAQLQIQSNQIESKVSDADFGTKITQNSKSIEYAWNNLSDVIKFENGKLYIGHDRNNYLLLGGEKMIELHLGGMTKSYNCLYEQKTVNHLNFNLDEWWHEVTLPDYFKGREFTVETSIQGWNFVNSSIPNTLATGVASLDFEKGTFRLFCNTGKKQKENINITYTVRA